MKRLSALVFLVALTGCFERDLILPGQRQDVRSLRSDGFVPISGPTVARAANQSLPLAVGAPAVNSSWTHRSGTASHSLQHPALNTTLQVAWSASIGKGNSRKNQITADPVVAGGRIFTLHSESRVMAHSTSGASIWSRDLVPPGEKSGDASGGGIAVGGARVFVTTGFGRLAALDMVSGGVIWQQDLESAVAAAPTVVGDLVYVVSRDGRAWALSTNSGRIRWQLQGTPSLSGSVGGAAPAVNDRVAIFPFSSGQMIAASRQGGSRLWSGQVSGGRLGRGYTEVTDISGDPVIVGDTVYAANYTGKAKAFSLSSGEEKWIANEGAVSPMWVAGGSVFLMSDQNELVRLDASNGRRIWGTKLPLFVKSKIKKRKKIFAHYGPVLAGGRLILASSDGLIRSFNPENGAQVASFALAGGAASNPVVAGRTLYVVTAKGKLVAYR
ncbi:MAG: PQQ-binding-like beta-propeller repeat protein [Rhodobacteraceae bacterium]|nr:PQQ-binding-like beta-propeller repeat protein [Paracoccaceae bacterium]